MKTVAYYDTPFEAEVARTKLQSEGIRSFVQNRNAAGVLPFAGGIGSLRPYVVVADPDEQRARQILQITEPKPLEACPECGSKDFSLRLSCRGRPMRGFWALPIFLLAGNTGAIRRDYYCRACGAWF